MDPALERTPSSRVALAVVLEGDEAAEGALGAPGRAPEAPDDREAPVNFSVMVGLLAATAGVPPLECRRISADFHELFGPMAMQQNVTLEAVEWFADEIRRAKAAP